MEEEEKREPGLGVKGGARFPTRLTAAFSFLRRPGRDPINEDGLTRVSRPLEAPARLSPGRASDRVSPCVLLSVRSA